MYGLIARIATTSGQRDALAAILLEGTKAMPGCLSYVIATDPADPESLWITEVWESQTSHKASLSLPAVQAAIATGRPMIAGFGSRVETVPIGGAGLGFTMPAFGQVIPVLTCRDIAAAHDFLVEVFGFAAGGVSRTPDGTPVHGEVRAGEAAIWLHRVSVEHQLNSPLAVDVANSGLVVHVDDVDAHYRRARAAGAQIDSEPVDQPYGLREYGARDLEGHRWWFVAPVNARAS